MLTLLEKVSFLGMMLTRWPFSCPYPVLCAVSDYTSEIKMKSGHELEHCIGTVQIFILLAQTLVWFCACKLVLSQTVARNGLGNSLGQGPFPKGCLDMAILLQWAGGFHLMLVSCAVPCSLKARPQFVAHFIFLHKHNHWYQWKRFGIIVLSSTNSDFLFSREDTAFF